MSLLKSDLKKLSIYGMGQVVNLVSPFLVVPYIIRISGIENFGKLSIAFSICLFLMVVIDYGNDITSVKDVSINRDNVPKLNKILLENISSRFLILVLVSFVYIVFSLFFSNNSILYLASFTIVIGQFLNPNWFLQGVEDVKLISLGNIVSKFIYIVLIFIFIKKSDHFIWVNFFWGIGMIVSYTCTYLLLIKQYRFKVYFIAFKDNIKFLKNNFSVFASQLFLAFQMFFPIIIIGKFGNYILAGQYKVLDQIISLFKTYIFLFFNLVYPKVSYKIHKENGNLNYWKVINGINFILIAIGCFVIYVLQDFILNFFEISSTVQIKSIFSIALLYPLIFSINVSLRQLILVYELNNFYVKTTSIVSLLYIFGTFFFVKYYSLKEIFICMILLEVILLLFYLIKLKDRINVKEIFTIHT